MVGEGRASKGALGRNPQDGRLGNADPVLPHYRDRANDAPVSGDMMIPDLGWLVGGGLVVIFLLVGWVRAARRGN
jgi:hypothetical protein